MPSFHARHISEDYDELTIDDDEQEGVDVVFDDAEEDDQVILLDRRVHPRIPVSMRVIELDGEVFCYQRAGNLSEGGLFIEGGLRSIGKQLTLMFVPPGSSTRIVTRAKVVGRIAGRRTGTCVRFLEDGTSEVRGWLRRYVREHLG